MRRARAGRRGRRRTRPPSFPAPRRGRPVVIVGDGPAGIFAALRLAELGVPAVIVERGKPVQARRRDLAALNKQGVVDPESNYCFGEGGAGTYSDGKLYTRAQKRGPVAMVLQQLVAHGADPAILVDARPHIGSHRLPRVVSAPRAMLATGGVETPRHDDRGAWRLLVLHAPRRLDRPRDDGAEGHSPERHVARAPRFAVREQRYRRRARAGGRRGARPSGSHGRYRAASSARARRVRCWRRRANRAGAARAR